MDRGKGREDLPSTGDRRADALESMPSAGRALIRMAEFTSDLIGLCDVDGQLRYLNPAGRRMIGIDGADIFPTRLTDYVVPEQRHLIDEEVLPAARRDGVWEGEMQVVNLATGQRIDTQRSTFAVHDEHGAISGYVSILRDVSHARLQERRLQREVETFHSLIAEDPFGIYLVDADFTLRVISRGSRKVFANIDPLIGRDFVEIIRILWPEPFASEVIGHFRHTLATGESYVAPTTIELRADISQTEAYDWRIDRVALPDGSHGVVCYFYDLTEREARRREVVASEAKLRVLAADLEQRVRLRTSALNAANARLTAEIERREATQAALVQSQKLEAVGQLTSGISHDFNNIMGAMLGAFSVIGRRTRDPALLEVIAMGRNAAERGTALVRRLMAFARQDTPEPEAVDMGALLRELRGLVQHGLPRNVVLNIASPDTTWPAFVDGSQLQTALLNLVINAGDAMPNGGILTITVRNAHADAEGHPPELARRDAVRILVADTGVGMPGAVLQRVLDPFFTTKDKGRGTGLGLAMVQGFVAQAGGAIRIESRPGAGTSFALYLPRADPTAPRARAGRAGEDGGPGSAFETVMLIDDDADFLGVIAAGLADFGYEVLTVGDATSAIALLGTRAVDALVCDIDLPGMSGIEFAEIMRRTDPARPCLLMTGGTGTVDGPDQVVLRKPFTPEALHRALGGAIAARDRVDSVQARFERIAARLKSDCARSLFSHWRALVRPGQLPHFDGFDLTMCSEPHRIVVAEVDLGRVPVDFRFTVIGDSLRERAPAAVDPGAMMMTGNDSVATREAAYRRCALSGQPNYEYVRFALDTDEAETVERLLLPFSSDGVSLDRIVGAVVIEREPNPSGATR